MEKQKPFFFVLEDLEEYWICYGIPPHKFFKVLSLPLDEVYGYCQTLNEQKEARC